MKIEILSTIARKWMFFYLGHHLSAVITTMRRLNVADASFCHVHT